MFLNPLLLFGMAAVSVPIIIHLLNRRRFERVQWAAMRFVKVSMEQNQRRMQIEDLLLLLIRCLILLLLALALARPVMRAAASMLGNTSVTAVVVLDNSASMAATDGTESRFEKAKRLADGLVEQLPAGSSVAVLLASDVVQEEFAEPTFDLGRARGAISEATLTDRGTNLFPAIDRATKILDAKPALRKEIYVISDGQAAGWEQANDIVKTLRGDERTQTDRIGSHVFFVGEAEARNVGVSMLEAASPLVMAGRVARVEAQVRNYGHSEVRDVRVVAYLNDSAAPVDEGTLEVIPAGESRGVSFNVKLPEEGFHSVRAVLDPAPDRLPRDNQRAAVMRALKRIHVLLVDGEVGREPRENETFFLQFALRSMDPVTGETGALEVKTIPATGLEAERLDDYDLIVLANVADMPGTVVGGLEHAVRSGKGLMIFPGGLANGAFYNEHLLKRGLLPAGLGKPVGDSNQGDEFVTFSADATHLKMHPVAALWAGGDRGDLTGPRFYRTYALEPVTGREDVRTVFWYSDKRPAVMERDVGLGKVMLFSSTADTAWNNLPVRPDVFLPLLHRAVGSLVRQQDHALNVQVGERFVFRTRSDLAGSDARFARPGEEDARAETRRVELQDSAALLGYDRTDLAGVYEVAVGPNAGDAVRFAAHAPAGESQVESVGQEKIDALRQVASVTQWKLGTSTGELIERSKTGAELWLYFAAAAVLLAAAETFLAHWFSQSK